ncbi:MAG: hypothetical protein AAFR96_08185 [Planctomycetota bacterium]
MATYVWVTELFKKEICEIIYNHRRRAKLTKWVAAIGIVISFGVVHKESEWIKSGNFTQFLINLVGHAHTFINVCIFTPLVLYALHRGARNSIKSQRRDAFMALRKFRRHFADTWVMGHRFSAIAETHRHIQVAIIYLATIFYQLISFVVQDVADLEGGARGRLLVIIWIGHTVVVLPSVIALFLIASSYIRWYYNILKIATNHKDLEWLSWLRSTARPITVVSDSAARHPLSLLFLGTPLAIAVFGQFLSLVDAKQ